MNGSTETKYYLIGAGGFVGSYILSLLIARDKNVVATAYPEDEQFLTLDIRDRDKVNALLGQSTEKDVVIHVAAQPNVELCESDPQATAQVNVEGTKNIVDCISDSKARYVFFSSEYVFDGQNGPYDENDDVKPLNEYGKQKLEAEHYIREKLLNYVIARTTTVYGYEKAAKNFLMSFTSRIKKGENVLVPHDQISTPTYVKDLASVTVSIADDQQARGILNIAGPELMSRYDFALKIAHIFQLPADRIKPVSTPELKQKALRPLKAGLKIDRLSQLGYTMTTLADALNEVKNDYGQYF